MCVCVCVHVHVLPVKCARACLTCVSINVTCIPCSFFGFHDSRGTGSIYTPTDEHEVACTCTHTNTTHMISIIYRHVPPPSPVPHINTCYNGPCMLHSTQLACLPYLAGFLQRHIWSENSLPHQQTGHPRCPWSGPPHVALQPCILPPLHWAILKVCPKPKAEVLGSYIRGIHQVTMIHVYANRQVQRRHFLQSGVYVIRICSLRQHRAMAAICVYI